MKHRYFRIDSGPWIERALQLTKIGEQLEDKARKIAEELESDSFYFQSSFSGYKTLAGFRPRADSDYTFHPDVWKHEKKSDVWVLRSRPRVKDWAEAHDAMREKLRPITRIPMPWSVLDDLGREYGLSNGPLVVVGNGAHSAGFRLITDMPRADGSLGPTIFLTIPWPDAAGDGCNDRFKQKLTIPDDWVEIKQWEKLRDIDLADTAREARTTP
jgi:hypothetical protein